MSFLCIGKAEKFSCKQIQLMSHFNSKARMLTTAVKLFRDNLESTGQRGIRGLKPKHSLIILLIVFEVWWWWTRKTGDKAAVILWHMWHIWCPWYRRLPDSVLWPTWRPGNTVPWQPKWRETLLWHLWKYDQVALASIIRVKSSRRIPKVVALSCWKVL